MDWARSVTGNTRLPRSVFSAHPFSSKKAMIFSGGKAVMALNRNLPFLGVFCSTSWAVQLLVTLQRPFPVISSFLPNRSFRSRIRIFAPFWAAVMAANIPAGPPPMIMPSYVIEIPQVFFSCFSYTSYSSQIRSRVSKVRASSFSRLEAMATIRAFTTLSGATRLSTKETMSLFASST